MTKVKVFVYGRRRQQQQRRRQQRRGYDNSSPDFRHGELKTIRVFIFVLEIKKNGSEKTNRFSFILLNFLDVK